jgi:hypothetical protein
MVRAEIAASLAEPTTGPRSGGAEQTLEIAEGELDCGSMLPLYAGFLLRDKRGSAARIWSSSTPDIVTSQMRWPPRVHSFPHSRPPRSHR